MKNMLIAAGLLIAGCASQGPGADISGQAEYIDSISEEPTEPDAISGEITSQVRSLLDVNLLDPAEVGRALGGVVWSPPSQRPVPHFVFSTYRGSGESRSTKFSAIEYTTRAPTRPGAKQDRAHLTLSLDPRVCYEGDVLKWGLRPDHSVELLMDPTDPRTIYAANSQGRTVLLTLGSGGPCMETIEIRFPEDLPLGTNSIR